MGPGVHSKAPPERPLSATLSFRCMIRMVETTSAKPQESLALYKLGSGLDHYYSDQEYNCSMGPSHFDPLAVENHCYQ